MAYAAVVTTSVVASQLQAIGSVGLILEASSLFSNVIAAVGLPIVPILGAIFFHESLDGIKVISIILAVWSFTSYVYQPYFHESTEIATKHIQSNAQESFKAVVPLRSV
ncbi:hypothetical protein SASPL_152281 [Salvia splendens]|uniref:Uncharacterized protein n=1 Tax=Salvia splendens TaxID=180675 RepID=A0A8X8W2Z4_SALSN|nr:hypothetical protein SASPL_152281 [Salvia splendens]